MAERLTIQIKDNDNVVVAVHDLPAGTKTESGVVTRDPMLLVCNKHNYRVTAFQLEMLPLFFAV